MAVGDGGGRGGEDDALDPGVERRRRARGACPRRRGGSARRDPRACGRRTGRRCAAGSGSRAPPRPSRHRPAGRARRIRGGEMSAPARASVSRTLSALRRIAQAAAHGVAGLEQRQRDMAAEEAGDAGQEHTVRHGLRTGVDFTAPSGHVGRPAGKAIPVGPSPHTRCSAMTLCAVARIASSAGMKGRPSRALASSASVRLDDAQLAEIAAHVGVDEAVEPHHPVGQLEARELDGTVAGALGAASSPSSAACRCRCRRGSGGRPPRGVVIASTCRAATSRTSIDDQRDVAARPARCRRAGG